MFELMISIDLALNVVTYVSVHLIIPSDLKTFKEKVKYFESILRIETTTIYL